MSKKTTNPKKRSRPIIGLINDSIVDPNSVIIWAGASEVAAAHDANLICFPAGALRTSHDFDAQANVLYDLVDPDMLGGLVFWGSLLRMYCSYDETRNFCKRFGSLPTVSIAIPTEGIPSVRLNGYQGMCDVIGHLIAAHQFKKIAFICGPDTHPEAQDRYRAYVDTLAANRIAFNPQLVAPGDFKKPSGERAVRLLLDDRRLMPEAIVAANDVMAIDAMEALQARGLQVPYDVSVVGFDDLAEARQITPPLTTVKQSFFEQAKQATEMVMEMFGGKTITADVVLPTATVIRQSCSCLDPLVVQAEALYQKAPAGAAASLAERRRIRKEMAAGNHWQRLSELAGILLRAFHRTLKSGSSTAFLKGLSEVLRQTVLSGEDLSRWHTVISALRRNALAGLSGKGEREKIENYFQQARVMIGETALQTSGNHLLKAEQKSRVLNEISQALITAFDRQELMNIVAREFPRLGIGCCYLSLYEDPAAPAEWSRLVLAYDKKGRRPLDPAGLRFPSRRLVPEGMLPTEERFSLIVEPLYFREEQIGFVLFEADPRQGSIYDTLRTLLSSALKGELLVRGIEQRSLELKLANEQAEKARGLAEAASQAKGMFLARMSHEIRTPMNSVIGFSDMLLDTPLGEEQTEFVRNITKSGEALLALINEILDFSKIEAGQLTFQNIDFDLEITAFDVCHITQPRLGSKPVEVFCHVDDNLPAFIKSDPTRIRQVLLNLMSNAIKFTHEGEIEMAVKIEEDTDTRLKLHTTVRDTGIGIPANKLETVFEVFQQVDGSITRKYGGTGLGLAICKQIARLLNGEVWVESELGKGSTFHFTAWVDKSEKEIAKKLPTEVLTGKKALLVDDNDNNLDILAHVLHLVGMRTEAVRRGDEVLPAAQRAIAAKDPFDICILDIQMPDMSGYEVSRQIRAQADEQVAKLLLLAFSSSVSRRIKMFKEAGFDGFLPKPIQRQTLLLMLRRLLGEAGEESDTDEPKAKGVVLTQHTLAEEAKHSVRLLLAEDNPMNQKLAQYMLTKAGYQLEMANNGREAVERFTADPERYDLIFMDVHMPEMDGLEATRVLRNRGYSGIPIVAMTADAMKEDREKCLEAGMNDYLSKPIKREDVFGMVTKWVLEREK
jgi:two-component system sensor histidine kinase/response regulator